MIQSCPQPSARWNDDGVWGTAPRERDSVLSRSTTESMTGTGMTPKVYPTFDWPRSSLRTVNRLALPRHQQKYEREEQSNTAHHRWIERCAIMVRNATGEHRVGQTGAQLRPVLLVVASRDLESESEEPTTTTDGIKVIGRRYSPSQGCHAQ